MDWSLKKTTWTASAVLALGLMAAWGVMSLAYAYESRLVRIGDSFNQAFAAVSRLDEMMGTLDRLSVDLQAFLSTRNARFSDAVWQDTNSLEMNISWLRDMAAGSRLRRSELDKLSAAVNQALGAVGQSFDVRDTQGKAGALAFFDTKQTAIAEAKAQANVLKVAVLVRVSDGIRDAQGSNGLIDVLFRGAPRGIAPPHGVSRPNLRISVPLPHPNSFLPVTAH